MYPNRFLLFSHRASQPKPRQCLRMILLLKFYSFCRRLKLESDLFFLQWGIPLPMSHPPSERIHSQLNCVLLEQKILLKKIFVFWVSAVTFSGIWNSSFLSVCFLTFSLALCFCQLICLFISLSVCLFSTINSFAWCKVFFASGLILFLCVGFCLNDLILH